MTSIVQLLGKAYTGVTNSLNRFVSGQFWILRSTVLIIIAALVLQASPGIRGVLERAGDTYTAVEIKTNDLTYDLTQQFPPESNQAKQNFRLVMPIIATVFGLNHIGLYLVQVAFGVGIIVLSLTTGQQLLQDRTSAFLIAFTVAMIYGGATGFVETQSRFDAPSIFFLLLAIRFRNPVVIMISVFLAAWNDERGLIAASLILAFWSVQPGVRNNSPWHLLRNPQLIGAIAGGMVYLISRYWFANAYDITTAGVDVFDHFIRNLTWLPLAIWLTFEGGWLIFLMSIALLLLHRRILESVVTVGALLIVIAVALSVVDISRSTAYALPALFLGLHVLSRYLDNREIRTITFASAALALLWPMYYIEGGLVWIFPLPLQPFV